MKDYFVSLYQVLKLIEYCSCQDRFDYSLFEEDNLQITDKELKIILNNISNEKLVTGIILFPNLAGFKAVSPQLTTKGYEYLAENSSMKKAYKIAKEIKGWFPGF